MNFIIDKTTWGFGYINNWDGLSSTWRHKNKTELKDLLYRTWDTSGIDQFSTNSLGINWCI